MSVMLTTRIDGLPDDADDHRAAPPLPVSNGKLMRLPLAPAASEQRILAVEFGSPDGPHWKAIGAGATVAVAIIDARESCPDDSTWDAVSWNELYGE